MFASRISGFHYKHIALHDLSSLMHVLRLQFEVSGVNYPFVLCRPVPFKQRDCAAGYMSCIKELDVKIVNAKWRVVIHACVAVHEARYLPLMESGTKMLLPCDL